MNTAGMEWADRVAARNEIEVAKAKAKDPFAIQVWQPSLFNSARLAAPLSASAQKPAAAIRRRQGFGGQVAMAGKEVR